MEHTENTEMKLGGLVGLFEQTQTAMQTQAARSMDIALVVRNWLFGWYIVEFENGGADRAELYGKALIKRLAEELKTSGLKGMSQTNLRKFREFYLAYPKIQQALPVTSSEIRQAVPDESFQLSENAEILQAATAKLRERFILGWTHYVTLLTLKNPDERRFYELEAAENGWGYRELERQINSALYERLALSRDKTEVKRLFVVSDLLECSVVKNIEAKQHD